MHFSLRTFTGQRPGPHLLVLGGVHGDEYEPIAAIRRLMSVIDAEHLSGQLTVVPIVNQPAFSAISRTGPDGLDLARTFPGRENGTTTEQIAHHISALICEADFLIDLHTGGIALKIAPLSGYMLHEDLNIREQQQKMARAFNLPIIWGTSANLQGRTLSVARDANVPAIYAEWGGGGGCDSRGVEDYVQGCLNVMSLLGMREGPRTENRVRYIVEDSRDESGHLQKNYPAEIPGYFEPNCQLHEQVQVGSVLGWICPLDFSEPVPVVSQQAGIVILLRSIPSVNVGDCLATILEIDEPGVVYHG